jgi:oligopeptidase B
MKPIHDLAPPVAARHSHSVTVHGVTLDDPWDWLRDKQYPTVDDPAVLAYLAAENAYFDANMAPLKGLTETILAELKGRVKQDDASVPVKDGDFEYWWRFQTGGQYRQWLRRPVAGGPEQLILDEPALAEGHDYFRLGGSSVSPDGRLLAYAVDTSGDERFILKVRDLATVADVETVTGVSVGVPVWAADSAALAGPR